MKILLIVPPYRTCDSLVNQLYPMPLGPVYLGTVLQQAGHQVIIKDFLVPQHRTTCLRPACYEGKFAPPYFHYGTPLEECKRWMAEHVPRYDAVGVACCQCNLWDMSQQICQTVRQLGKPLVVGGPFVTTATEEALDKFRPDVAVRFEGEGVVVEAFERAIRGEKMVIEGHKMKMEDLPLPDWSLAPPQNYPKFNGRVRGVLTISRGCPWDCEFCSVFTIMSRKHRRLDRNGIVQSIVNLWDQGVRYFCFLDDNLFISPKYADEVFGAIRDCDVSIPEFRQKARFYVEEGIEVRMAANRTFVEQLADDPRWDNVAIGLETANAAAAKQARKPYTEDQLAEAIENFRRTNITPKAFYIIGFPNDTIQSVARDIVEFAKMGMMVRPNNLKLYPGTPVTQWFRDHHRIGDDYDWRLSTFYTPPTGKMAYKQIRKMKTILNAVGLAAGEFGINPFADDLPHIFDQINRSGLSAEYGEEDGMVTFTGNMFRPTPYRVLAEILCIRHSMGAGAKSETGKVKGGKGTWVKATAMKKPKDEYQAAIVEVMGVKPKKKGFGLS